MFGHGGFHVRASPCRVSRVATGCRCSQPDTNTAESSAFALLHMSQSLHRSTFAPSVDMTEEAPSIRSSQGSSRRAPKNVSIPSVFRTIGPGPPTLQSLTLSAMQPQQQLSQIEKSVTHLLVATKQLLGSSTAPTPPGPLLTPPRDFDTMVARDRHRE